MLWFRPFLLVWLIALSGCTSYYARTFELESPSRGSTTAISMDIRQRVLVVGNKQTLNKDGQAISNQLVICAEPSPDAMSAVNSSLSASLQGDPDRTLELANSFNESAAFVGNRTQTIQLLRDGMYRLCEGHLSGALSEFQYEWQMRRYQRNMVGLLAIEALTQTIRPPSVILASTAKAQIGQSIARLEEQLDANKKRISAIQAEIAELSEDDTEKKEQLTADLERYQGTQKALESAISDGQSALAAGSTSGSFNTNGAESQLTDVDVTKITATIDNIIEKIYQHGDRNALCFEAFLDTDFDKWDMFERICSSILKGASTGTGDSSGQGDNAGAGDSVGTDNRKSPEDWEIFTVGDKHFIKVPDDSESSQVPGGIGEIFSIGDSYYQQLGE